VKGSSLIHPDSVREEIRHFGTWVRPRARAHVGGLYKPNLMPKAERLGAASGA
jgi:hypothetical protein